jgi:hypothetical protein
VVRQPPIHALPEHPGRAELITGFPKRALEKFLSEQGKFRPLAAEIYPVFFHANPFEESPEAVWFSGRISSEIGAFLGSKRVLDERS